VRVAAERPLTSVLARKPDRLWYPLSRFGRSARVAYLLMAGLPHGQSSFPDTRSLVDGRAWQAQGITTACVGRSAVISPDRLYRCDIDF
jgi:hypothetical protein